MTDPMKDDPQTLRALRYTELDDIDRATVAVRCLKRLGKLKPKMEPRELTHGEAMVLEEDDFAWISLRSPTSR